MGSDDFAAAVYELEITIEFEVGRAPVRNLGKIDHQRAMNDGASIDGQIRLCGIPGRGVFSIGHENDTRKPGVAGHIGGRCGNDSDGVLRTADAPVGSSTTRPAAPTHLYS